jgi:protein-S-isoprenylcysteine O-methyltransferase Ste14
MKNVGKGNPMDAFNHEVAPRTVNLMTDGPYRICRNPMLLGVFIYYIGLLICLQSWKAAVVFVAFFAVMMLQVNREEKRLKEDFGEAYIDYCKKTKKLIPYIW